MIDIDMDRVFEGLKCHWDKSIKCESGFFCGGCEHQPDDDDKPNGRKDPVRIRWENDYGMMIPYCPSCGEMAYSTERCVFCGQKLISENKPRNKMVVMGGHDDENGIITCDKCGGKDNMELISHADGAGFFEYTYRCGGCGNHITMRTLLNQFEEVSE